MVPSFSIALGLVAGGFLQGPGPEELVFRDALSSSGVDYLNVSGELEKRTILSTLSSGIGLMDFDQDGDLDLYLANGARLVEGRVQAVRGDRLYRNDGGWSFTDVTARAGLGTERWGVGVAVGDYDNDGFPDLYLTTIGPNLLYRNRGDGTFHEAGERAGVADASWGTSAAFFDADDDGNDDLYVANYVRVDLTSLPRPGTEPRCQWFGLDVMCGPKGLPGTSDAFFRNSGDGSFSDATEEAGLLDPTGAYGLGVVAADFDEDGDMDLYVANDSVPNFLYRNDGHGTFTEVALLSGVALSGEGLPQAGMGVDAGDLDGNGTTDLFVTNFSHETNNAYMNHGGGIFLDTVGESNLHGASWFSLGWGVRFVDLDHDGDQDVFVANGHVYPGVDDTNLKTRYRQRNQIFWNDGRGTFSETEPSPDDAMQRLAASRSAAFGDLDEDGDLDGVVMNVDDAPSLLENRLERKGRSVTLRLVGRESSRDAAGAVVALEIGDLRYVHIVHSSGSFLAASDIRVHFGVGAAQGINRVLVRWPSGSTQIIGPLSVGRLAIILEDVGLVP